VNKPFQAFLDTSALFAGMWASTGGANLILQLGEVEAIRVLVSSHVLIELETALQRQAPDLLTELAALLAQARISIAEKGSDARFEQCLTIVDHRGDARVLADAWDAGIDYFVTLDKKHFLSNHSSQVELPFEIGTPGDFIVWYRTKLHQR